MHRARSSKVGYVRSPDIDGLEAAYFDGFVGERSYYARREFIFAFGAGTGTRTFKYRGESRRAKASDLVIVQAGEPYVVEVKKATDIKWLYVDVSLLRRVTGLEEGRIARLPFFHDPTPNDPVLSRMVAKLHKAVVERSPLAERQKLLSDVLHRALARHTRPRQPGPRGKRKADMKMARDHMQDELSRNVPLKELADMTGLSVFQFVRTFNKEIGLTPHALLIQMRVQRARELLRKGKTATEASQESGFADPSHLVRHFKRVFKVTPGTYAAAARVR